MAKLGVVDLNASYANELTLNYPSNELAVNPTIQNISTNFEKRTRSSKIFDLMRNHSITAPQSR